MNIIYYIFFFLDKGFAKIFIINIFRIYIFCRKDNRVELGVISRRVNDRRRRREDEESRLLGRKPSVCLPCIIQWSFLYWLLAGGATSIRSTEIIFQVQQNIESTYLGKREALSMWVHHFHNSTFHPTSHCPPRGGAEVKKGRPAILVGCCV